MAFGNPYGDPWSFDEVVDAVDLLESQDIRTISLADTVGLAPPEKIHNVVSAVMAKFNYLEIGVHLHSRPDEAAAKILAAYDAGCRRFDSAIGGLGGCPFAQDALVGNLPTEVAVDAFKTRGAALPPLKSLDALLKASNEIGVRYSSASEAVDD
jgi:hydroxymethylglutaryl-CoA lyase